MTITSALIQMVSAIVQVLKYLYSVIGTNTGQGFPQGDGTMSVSLDSRHFLLEAPVNHRCIRSRTCTRHPRRRAKWRLLDACSTGSDHTFDVELADSTEVPIRRIRHPCRETFAADSFNACINVFMTMNTVRTSQLFGDFATIGFKDRFEVDRVKDMTTLPTVFEARLPTEV